MFYDDISYEYLGGATINCNFTSGKNYYCVGSFKNRRSFYIDDNQNVRIVSDDCFKPVKKDVKVVIELPKLPKERSDRIRLCERWEITEPTLKDWFETRPFLIKDAINGLNSKQLALVDLPELSRETGNYLAELAVRWGYYNQQSVTRIINRGKRLKLFSDAFQGLLK